MRYITADYIFPVSSPPIKNGIITVSDGGKIVDVKTANNQQPTTNIEKYEGIICPGFINAHCHLELSYMKGMIEEKLGMAGFIKNIISKRGNVENEKISEAIVNEEQKMYENGIVGVGDISNDDSTFIQKAKGNIKYHTFFEVFDLNPEKAEGIFHSAQQLQKIYFEKLKEQQTAPSSSIVPHAPYSVSPELFKLIASQQKETLISYHNQESVAESELYVNKTGAIAELFTSMGINLDYIKAEGKNSLQSVLPYFSSQHKLLFVHNTYTSHGDLKSHPDSYRNSNLKSLPDRQAGQIYFCFCPNANLYIENRLPDINLFISQNCNIVVGTDSLASNHSLSVLEELKTISNHFPEIPLHTLITWATKNGAEYFGWIKEFGSIEQGKNPGLLLIKNIDKENLQLTETSEVQRLI